MFPALEETTHFLIYMYTLLLFLIGFTIGPQIDCVQWDWN